MRFATILVSLALLLVLAGPAGARGGHDELSGIGELVQKDMGAMTLTIQGRTYHVIDRTRIIDRDGRLITLAQLDVPQAGEKGLWEILAGRYEAVERGNRLVLISLELVPSPD